MQTRKFEFLLLFLTPVLSLAAEPPYESLSPDRRTIIYWQCSDSWERNCDVRAKSGEGGLESVWKEVPAPTVTWHGNDLAEIRVSCGAPCFYSKFYSPKWGVSDSIEFVTAVLASRCLAVRATVKELEVINIFEKNPKPVSVVKLGFAPAAALVNVLDEVRFVGENELFVRYLSGNDFVEKSKTIELNIK